MASTHSQHSMNRLSWILAGVCLTAILQQSYSFTSRIFHYQSDSVRRSTLSPSESAVETSKGSYLSFKPPSSNTSKLWKQVCPPYWNPKESKVVTLLWSCCDDTEKVAAELARSLDPSWSYDPLALESLIKSLNEFRDFCTDNLYPTSDAVTRKESFGSHGYKFKARIVATRGSSGTKCPQWHVDHVPVRWIQSLVGPGCEVVAGNVQQGINWDLVNGLGEEDEDEDEIMDGPVIDRNRALVSEDVADIYAGQEQEALLLKGNRWSDFAKDPTPIQPVVHKSPTIPWGRERVLLTQDLILDESVG